MNVTTQLKISEYITCGGVTMVADFFQANMGFVHVLNNFFRVQNILYVYQILYAYKTLFYMQKCVLNENTYTTILHMYKTCVPIKNVLSMCRKFVYAYQIFCMSTKCCVLIQPSVICVLNALCVYKIVCTRTK